MQVAVEASEKYGVFDVVLDDTLVFSKLNKGRMPLPGEVEEAVFEIINKG